MTASGRRQPKPASPDEVILTPAQVAWLTKRHEETVTLALRDGSLRGHQNGERGRWFVQRDDALAWVMGKNFKEAA